MNPLQAVLISVLLSIAPVSELRGGIPFAVANGFTPIAAFIFCTIANIIAIFLIFLFFDHAHKHLLKWRPYKKVSTAFLNKIRKRKKRIEKAYQTYGIIVLTLFVAIPLPVTGAWTGSIIAWLLKLKRKRSYLAIALGVVISGIIVTLVTEGVIKIFSSFI